MKRIILSLLLLLALPVSVVANAPDSDTNVSGSDIRVKMIAEVLSVGDEIYVRVLESEYTSGVHIVITGEATKYFNACHEKMSHEDIKVGDRVEIFYNGQVMMSYPPKIVARKIVIL